MSELFFDTETSDMVKWSLDEKEPSQPWLIQLGAILSTDNLILGELNAMIDCIDLAMRRQEKFYIASGAADAHGIVEEMIRDYGLPGRHVMLTFLNMLKKADTVVCHNVDFDKKMLKVMCVKMGLNVDMFGPIDKKEWICTMKTSTDICRLPGKFGKFKWPKLQELHCHLFGVGFTGAHDAMEDIRATRRCFYELRKRGVV